MKNMLLNNFREKLRQYPKVHSLTRRLYRQVIGQPEPFISRTIRSALTNQPDVFFVQVGSHDGITGDPLHNLIIENQNYQGILIEPVPHNFELLKQTYERAKNMSERLKFENVAISQVSESKKFYCLSQDIEKDEELKASLPLTYDQLSSFNAGHIKKLGDEIIPYILEITVPCLSLKDLFDKHQVKTLDLLHIDVEGFDYSVLSQLDFSKYQPKVILYEHAHLSTYERNEAIALLNRHGYELLVHGGDTLAIYT